MTSQSLPLRRIQERFGGSLLGVHSQHGDDTVLIDPDSNLEVLRFCRDEPDLAFNFLMDLTCVDYLGFEGREGAPRFEVVYHLYSLEHNHRLRVKCPLGDEDPSIASAVELWPVADWQEREAWDMYGVTFEGHPNLKRILMYEEFEGHPLRKDYPVNKRQPLVGPKD